jgi:hypothetical protein
MIMKRSDLLLALLLSVNSAYAASFIGTYHCTGHDPYLNRDYTGTVVIAQQNTVYKISMTYDTGEKYIATGGQYNEELLSVVFQDVNDLHKVGLEQYRLTPNRKQMGGYWVYLGEDKLGREVCLKEGATLSSSLPGYVVYLLQPPF